MAPTSGSASRWRRFYGWVGARQKRFNFTINVGLAFVALFFILIWAGIDFYQALRHKDAQLQEAGLRSQLVQFLLMTTREPDASSLLDNPADFALSRRSLKVVTVRKPFFSFFLTRDNFQTFRKDAVRSEYPRACILEFPVDVEDASQRSLPPVQVCFAVVQNDAAGRYVYAMIKYPSRQVTQHRRGQPLSRGDTVRLRFNTGRGAPTTLRLALEEPNLPIKARRMTPARFEGLHEVAGFLNDDGGRPTPYVSGQAIERVEHADGTRLVTIAIRIDASIFNARFDSWPDAMLKSATIGLEIHRLDAPPIILPESQKGTALVSLAQAYLTAVPSGATLNIWRGDEAGRPFWTSKELEPPGLKASPGVLQRAGDALASLLKGAPIHVVQPVQSPGTGSLKAELSSAGNELPDVAARVLALLALAAVLVIVLAVLGLSVARTLARITTDALALTKRRHGDECAKYKRRRDQVGIIGRVIYSLDQRIRAKVESQARTLAREANTVRQLQLSLHLIAHEIRSPVATLGLLHPEPGETRRLLDQMRGAIEIFTEMERLDSEKSPVQLAPHDLAASLSAYAAGLSSDGVQVSYEGVQSSVLAQYDDILLDNVLRAVIDNAKRYAKSGTPIVLRITASGRAGVEFEVFNQGSQVVDTEAIFLCGHSSHDTPENRGFGLYAARHYVTRCGGFIQGKNFPDGFAIVVKLLPA